MGVVYKAEDINLGRHVALKFLSELLSGDNAALERFQREARAASALDHPNICTIYEIGAHAGLPFIAMQHLEGQTLDKLISGKPLPVDDAVKIGIQIADALEAVHAVGIIHRDIKPANIFVTRRGQTKVLDFGIAKLSLELRTGAPGLSGKPPTTVDAVFTSPGAHVGTFAYMSPEQERGEDLDARSDLFSFGLVLYDMVTGWNTFSDKVASVVHNAVGSTAGQRSAPQLPPGLGAIIDRATQVDRNLRYQTAAEMRADLQQLKRDTDFGRRDREGDAGSVLISAASPLSSAGKRRSKTLAVQTAALRPERLSKNIGSLAVFPFENVSRDPENEYLSDGIPGSLINILATIPRLRVIAQSTVFRYKGQQIDPQAVGRELNVRAVLTGRMMQSGGSLRIGTELVDVATGAQLWGAQFDRKPGDIFVIQDEISNEISGKLRLQLTRAEKKRLIKRHTEDAEAYRLYLKGRHHWNRWTEEGFYKSIGYFQQAIEKDPSFALAYTGLAESYVLLGWNSYLPPKDAFPKGKAAAMTALQLDPSLGEAHTPLAAALWLYDWQWQEAQTEFKRSLELNPTYPTANHWHAEYVMTMGRQVEAIAKMKNSQELDPLSLIINVAIGWASYMARRYDDAIEQLLRTVELDPNYPVTYWILGLLYRITGRYELAVTAGEKGVNLSGGSPLMRAALAHTYGMSGRAKEALQVLDDLTKLAKHKYVAPHFLTGIHIGLGENECAIECLEKSYEEHSHWLIYLHIDPSMDVLRSNPRFQDLLRRVGLPALATANPA